MIDILYELKRSCKAFVLSSKSLKIFRQVHGMQKMPKKYLPHPKKRFLSSMEELIQNFMIVTEGPQIPAGEVYFEAENPKGALVFILFPKVVVYLIA